MYYYRNVDGSFQTSNLALDDGSLTEITPEEYAAAVDEIEAEIKSEYATLTKKRCRTVEELEKENAELREQIDKLKSQNKK